MFFVYFSFLASVTLTNWKIKLKHFANIFVNCSHLVKLQNTSDEIFMLHENCWLVLGCFDESKSDLLKGKISTELRSIHEPLLLTSLVVTTLVTEGWWYSLFEFIRISACVCVMAIPSLTCLSKHFLNLNSIRVEKIWCGWIFISFDAL